MSSVDQSVADQVANKVLQELYCDIIDQLSVSDVSAQLYSKHKITLTELDQLHDLSGMIPDYQKRHRLYSTALAGKGKQAVDVFLSILDETAIHHKPHALLAHKLRVKLQEYEHQFRDRTLASCKSVPLSTSDVLTHQTLCTNPLLPETSSTGARVMSTQKSTLIPIHSGAFIIPTSSVTDQSHVPTFDVTATKGSSQEQEVQCLLVINGTM